MSTLLQDLRYAARTLRRSPGFAVAAVLSLALGIGANATIFSVVDSVLLRPLPVPEPQRIVKVYAKRADWQGYRGLSHPNYLDQRDRNRAFAALAAYEPVPTSLSEGGRPERAWGYMVSANYFSTLGVPAALGRTFLAEEDFPGAAAALVLSHDLWMRQFASDPKVVGRSVLLNGHSFQVVGVVPKGFAGTEIIFKPDFYVPLAMHEQIVPGTRGALAERGDEGLWFRVVGRLAPGVTIAQAQAATTAVATQLESTYPRENRGLRMVTIAERATRPEPEIARGTTLSAVLLMALVGGVLLVACANVANLLLVRAARRRREIGVRLALGAARGRLVRQLLTESLLLSLAGGGLGLLIALWTSRLVQSIYPPTDIPLGIPVTTDHRTFLFALAVSVSAAVLFGLLPALRASRASLVPALRGEVIWARRALAPRLREGLVVAQIAVSLVLLVSAGLLVKSLVKAQAVDPGFRPQGLLLASLDVALSGYDEPRGRAFYRELLGRVEALPEVRSATLAGYLPLDFVGNGRRLLLDQPAGPSGTRDLDVLASTVGRSYFETTGTAVLRGRAFTDADDRSAPPVAIVNEKLAERLWPGEEPLGKRLRFASGDDSPREVVGVVRNGRYRNLAEAPRPYLFLPFEQDYQPSMTVVLRTAGDPAGLASALAREVRALDPELPVSDVKTGAEHMARSFIMYRFLAWLAGALSVLGLLLSVIGLYGVISYFAAQRTKEIGIRMALGARPRDVLTIVIARGMGLASVGLAVGTGVALVATRVLSGLLLDVSAADPWTFTAVILLLATVALVATAVPAWRAVSADPLDALRQET